MGDLVRKRLSNVVATPPKSRAKREKEVGAIIGVDPRHPIIREAVEIERGERNRDGSWKTHTVKLQTKFTNDKKDPGYILPFLRRVELPVYCLSKRQQALYHAGKLEL